MAKCPNCKKEIAFSLAYWKGIIPREECGCGAGPYICNHCHAVSRLTSKCSSILALGMALTVLLGYGLTEFIKLDSLFIIYGIFIWFLFGWPYIWWKKIAKLEIKLET